MASQGSSTAGLALAGLLVGIGLAAAGWFASQTVLTARIGANTATVKGLSERRVDSDRAVWRIGYFQTGESEDEIPALARRLRETEARIVALLKEEGFTDAEVSVEAMDRQEDIFRNREGIVTSSEYTVRGGVTVETDRVATIAPARFAIADLILDGLDVESGTPTYTFGGLNAIKPDMVREATNNARIAAEEFAKNAGVDVGAIKVARQGGFSIRDAGSEFEETGEIEKDVRVVTTIEFYLTE